MRKSVSVFATMAIIVGIVSMIVGFTAVGWDVNKLDSINAVEQTVTYDKIKEIEGQESVEGSPAVETISVTNKNGGVNISKGSEFQIKYYDTTYFTYNVSYSEGELKIDYVKLKDNPIVNMDMFGQNFRKAVIWITVDKEMDINVTTTNAHIEVEGGKYKNLDLDTTNAHVSVDNVNTSALNVKSTNGSVNVNNSVFEGADIETKNASVQITETNIENNVKAVTKSGSITLDDVKAANAEIKSENASLRIYSVEFSALSAKTTNGSIKLEDVKAAQVSAVTTNGSIKIENLNSDDIVLQTTNASVKGNIIGARNEFDVSAETKESSNLSNGGGGPKKLKIYTTHGSIKITFTKD